MSAADTERSGNSRVLLVAQSYIIWPALMVPGDALCLYEHEGGLSVLRYIDNDWISVCAHYGATHDWARIARIDQLRPCDPCDAINLSRLATTSRGCAARPRKGLPQ